MDISNKIQLIRLLIHILVGQIMGNIFNTENYFCILQIKKKIYWIISEKYFLFEVYY